MSELDDLDRLAADVFEGYLVRKDLAQQFRGQYPVPTYVGEFLLGRYCATTDPDEIAEGLAVVERSMKERTVRAGEEELFKSRAREKGKVKIIDLLRARLDAKADAYKAELPSLQLSDIHISDQLVNEHDRMLTGGFYAEVTLEYIAALGKESGGQPFRVESVRPIQMSTRDALDTFVAGRAQFTLDQWRDLLLRSVGFEPVAVHRARAGHPARPHGAVRRARTTTLSSSAPGARASPTCSSRSRRMPTSSRAARQRSPTCSSTTRTGRRGLVAQYDVVCFDEVSGVSFDTKEGVNILKGYMESGEFSRGKESIRADGGIVMVGNFDVDVRRGASSGPPLRADAEGDARRHRLPRPHPRLPARLGRSEARPVVLHEPLRLRQRLPRRVLEPAAPGLTARGHTGAARVGQPAKRPRPQGGEQHGQRPAQAPVAGPDMEVPDEALAWAAELALELRRRVKEQQALIGVAEFGNVDLSYRVGDGPRRSCTATRRSSIASRAERGCRPAARRTGDSEVLPEPDPAEVQSSRWREGDRLRRRRRHRWPVRDSRRSRPGRLLQGLPRPRRGRRRGARAQALRQRRRLRRCASRDRRASEGPPSATWSRCYWAGKTSDGDWYLITEYIDGESLDEYATGKQHLRDREAVDVALDVLDALVAIHPDSVRLDELDRKKRGDGELSEAEYQRVDASSRTRASFTETSSRSTSC